MAQFYPPVAPTLWLRSRSLVGLKNGDPVSTWFDSSGNGRNFTAAGAGRPTYKDDGSSLTGKPYVYFDGATSFMLGPNLDQIINASVGTVIVVARPDAGIVANNATANQNPALFGSNTSAQAAGLFCKNVGAGTKQVISWSSDGVTPGAAAFSLIEQAWGFWHAHTWLLVGGAVYSVHDYAPQQFVGVGCGNAGQINTAAALGRNYQQTQFYNGGIGEVMAFGSGLSSSTLWQVWAYLRAEWQG